MNSPATQAGLPQQQHTTEAGRHDTPAVLSAQEARKLLSLPGVTSFRQGAVLIVVDAKGQQYIVKDLEAQASPPQASPDDADRTDGTDSTDDTAQRAGQETPEEAPADLQVPAASAEVASATLAEVHMAQAPADSAQPEAKSDDETCKDDDDKKDANGDEEDDDDACLVLWDSGSGWGLGLAGVGLAAAMGGGGGSGGSSGGGSGGGTPGDPPPVDTTPPTPPSAPDLAAEDDSGVSDTDNITVYTTGLNFSGTAEAGATVSLFVDANSNGVIDSGELVLGTGVATGGNYSIDTSLVVGNYKVRAIATDLAGNVSAASGTTVVRVIPLPPAPGFVINGQSAGDYSGYSVSSAGDVNGDGLADLIVGAPYADGDTGRSYVVFGKADGTVVELSDMAAGGTDGFMINGQSVDDESGYSVSAAGDVNGDGLADLIVGAPNAEGWAGRSYVVFGKTGYAPMELSAVAAGATGGFVINGQSAGGQSGWSVSSAGDVNGDGLADLIVGAPYAEGNTGRSYVVFGKTEGAAVELSDIAAGGTGGFVINGQSAWGRSGYSVSAAGDVNGDGLADLIVGAPGADGNAGRSYVVFGKTGGPAVELFDIADHETDGFVINGQSAWDRSGYSVSAAGDVNGDGLADLIVGAHWSDPATGGTNAGRSYVVFGKTRGTAVELSDMAAGGTDGFVINGQSDYDNSGWSVSSAGDVNGDGLADLIVGARYAEGIAGRSYVVLGKTDGTAVELSVIEAGAGGGFVINGQSAGDTSGYSVSAAGDVNGDGLADLIVGAPYGAPTTDREYAGRSYVIFGKTGFDAVNLGDVALGGDAALPFDFAGTSDPDTWNGTTASETALGGAGDDTLTGNGGADVLYGGAGNDTLVLNADNIAHLSQGLTDGRLARVDGGGGIDTLAVAGAGVTLDLTQIANQAAGDPETGSRIASIEKINLSGTGNNTLTLSVGDVLDMAGMNQFNTENGWSNVTGTALGTQVQRHQLVIDGDAGDVVNSFEAPGTWSLVGTASDGTNTYKVFNATNSATSAQLLVNTNITQALDTTAPIPPSAPDLAAEDDSGTSDTDDITVYTTGLNFSGTAEAGATVSLFVDANSNGVIDSGELVLGTGVATGGNYSIDTNLAVGNYKVRAIATDLAGNVSEASGTTVVEVISAPPALGFVINGQSALDESGYSVSSAGDVNGDGLADLIVGAREPAGGAGRSYVVFGKADGTVVELSDIAAGGTAGFAINGQAANDLSGWSVSSAGDVNGDGLADLIVGAPWVDPIGGGAALFAGRSYVVFGKDDGAAVDLSAIAAGGSSDGFVINGQAAWNVSGASVSSAGDVNGDGLADLIVGAQLAGRSYVVFGKTSGMAVELSAVAAGGTAGFVINGQSAGDRSGESVSSAGDVNGDGLADLIVGARFGTPAMGGDYAGRSYVVFGKADGTAIDLATIAAGTGGGFVINGQSAWDESGYSVSSAGDVNGDGLADLIVGAYLSDPTTGGAQAGRSYVVFGKTGGTPLDLSAIAAGGTDGFVINGQSAWDNSGHSVSAAGDVNGDGLADLIVGAPWAQGGAGRSYVVFGKTDGTAVELSVIEAGAGGGFVINGQSAGDFSGYSVSSAGDVNGDGLADLIVGAPYGAPTTDREYAGRSYVIFGKTGFDAVNLGDVALGGDAALPFDFAGTSDPDTWNGTTASETALGGAGDDTLTGNGGADVLYGGAGNDTLVLNADNIAHLSQGLTDGRLARVDGGGGIDTLAVAGAGVTLDLTQIANQAAGDPETGSRIASIEKINLSGTGNNTLNLSVGDVLDMAGMNQFNTTNGWSNVTGTALGTQVLRHQLVIDGDADDQLTSPDAAGTWNFVGTVSDGEGNTYNVFNATNSATSAQLLVNTNITQTLDTLVLPPNPPSAPDLAAEDDSGVSDTDNITTYTTGLSFSGTAQEGVTVSLFVDVNNNGVMNMGELLGTGVATGGNYSIDTNLAVGNYNVRAIATDLAGNVSEASGTTVVRVIPPSLGFVINGQSAGDESGYSVSSAGDVNGDGLADLIVGAPLAAGGAGRSYVVFGKADGRVVELSDMAAGGTDGFVINGQSAFYNSSGEFVSAAGDVNGDGLADLIVGAPYEEGSAGRSYVVFGKTGGAAVELSDIADNQTGGFVINGQSAWDRSGRSVSSAGDVNGDGLADLIVGASEANGDTGRSYVVFGKTGGMAVDLSAIAAGGTDGFVISGQSELDFSGESVSAAGDVNGDGLADLIVGAYGSDPEGRWNAGRSYVVFGKADGVAVELSDIAAGGMAGFVINGPLEGGASGRSVSSAGDVNGDGLADVIVGAPLAGGYAGRSYVVFGQTDATAVELSDIADNQTGGFVINGQSAGDWSGWSVSSAGDVNGDGLADLIVGASSANGSTGRSYVVFGKTGGTPVELSAIAAGTGGFVINGQSADDNSGYSVSAAGDVNGDGLADLIVGAFGADADTGRSYVIFGKTDTAAVNLGDVALGGDAALVVNDTWSGTTASETALGGAGNDTLTGNGGADVLYGGAGNDT
ncbi:MAG: FG-GAP-like repeat-containing protein, partial [Hydrogenophaga sp.]|uniref:FG-GAP-like repeat-containing protein n=1 Tax=Hydrogenophaga sp. TaxID=1904254 RepID=UPI003D0FFB47